MLVSQSIADDISPVSNMERYVLPKFDNQQAFIQNLNESRKGRAEKFAHPFPVQLNLKNAGTWEKRSDGTDVWRCRMYSEDAVSINLGFSEFYLPEGASLFIYSIDRKRILGPFSFEDNELHREMWTPILDTDEIIVELQIPSDQIYACSLEITTINHAFKELFVSDNSGSCNLDVICSAADGFEEVDDYRDQINSVAYITVNGNTQCTGFLINNTNQDCKPLFMTANHCMEFSSQAPSLVVYWNYENSYCRLPGSSASGASGDGPLDKINTGSVYLAGYDPTDFTLVELDDPVVPNHLPFYAGWSKEDIAPNGSFCVHHPNGDEKRISFEMDQSFITDNQDDFPDPTESHIMVEDWDVGTTEVGSSGSPLFNMDGQVIGQLQSGFAACGNDDSDWYGRLAASWEGGGNPVNRLKDWLDPLNTGALKIDGLNCSAQIVLTAQDYEICLPGSIEITANIGQGFDNGNTFVEILNLPNEITANYATGPYDVGDEVVVDLVIDNNIQADLYDIQIRAYDSSKSNVKNLKLFISNDVPVAPSIITPGSNSVTGVFPEFTWNMSEVNRYEFQLASDASFSNTIIQESNMTGSSYIVISPLDPETEYYARIRADNYCGAGPWSDVLPFKTAAIICEEKVKASLDLDIGPQIASTVSSIFINELGTVDNIEVVNLDIDHSWIGDLDITLKSPEGSFIKLMERPCNNQTGMEEIACGFDPASFVIAPCPPNTNEAYASVEDMSTFFGQTITGEWQLIIDDLANLDGGTLNSWGLNYCTQAGLTSTVYPQINSLKVYPNPSQNGSWKITFEQALKENATLKLFDYSGRMVHEEAVAAANRSWQLSKPELAAGVYFLHIFSGEQHLQKKLINIAD